MKNVIAYDLQLPPMGELETALKNKLLPELTELSYSVSGFVPHPLGNGEQLVLPFHGGVSFAFAIDEKIIPASLVNKRVAQGAKQYIAEHGFEEDRVLSRKEKSQIKEQVLSELLPKALPKSKIVLVYYRPQEQLLLIDDASDGWATLIISALIHCIGTLKTTTIHVSGLKSGLHQRLKQLTLENNKQAFEGLNVGGRVRLQLEKEKISFDQTYLDVEQVGDWMARGYQVLELELYDDNLSVIFTHDFVLKRLEFLGNTAEYEAEDSLEVWQHEQGVQTLLIANLLNKLSQMFGFGTEEEIDQAA